MKQLAHVITIAVLISVAIMAVTNAHAQGDAESKSQKLDTRVWNQSYRMEMARRGLVEVTHPAPAKEAVYTGSRIEARGVKAEDSPDVPVTTITNTTQSENSVFVHPLDNNTVLNSNNSTDWVGGYVYTLYGADALFTKDGGTTWGGQITGAGGTNSGDPATAIGLNGRWYVGYVAATYDQGVAYSTDAGTTWTHVLAAGGGYVLDKNHLWIPPDLPPSPLRPSHVERVLRRGELLPPGVECQELEPSSFKMRLPGQAEWSRVTASPEMFDEHFESHQMVLHGSPVFGKLVACSGIDPDAETSGAEVTLAGLLGAGWST